MKVYIHTDIEGVAGWVFWGSRSKSFANHYHSQRMNQLLTNEVKAACRAAIDSGADEVWVNDSHGCCYSILFEQLPKQCPIIHGRPAYFDAWLAYFDSTIDALVCIGQHAMAGTPHAVNPHSLWHVNGGEIKLSECTMAAALAGYHDVPCVCVSGDEKICAEAKQKIPQLETVDVKWAIAAQNARSLTPETACEKIYQGVQEALKRKDDIPPFKIPGPYRLNISDRDPSKMILKRDGEGEDFWQTVHDTLNKTSYSNYGQDPIDDGSYRWPD